MAGNAVDADGYTLRAVHEYPVVDILALVEALIM